MMLQQSQWDLQNIYVVVVVVVVVVIVVMSMNNMLGYSLLTQSGNEDGDAYRNHKWSLWAGSVLWTCWASKWRPGSTCFWWMLWSELRCCLFCEACQRDLRLAFTRFESVDRLGWQKGNQLVSLQCQQHLTLPAQHQIRWWQTWEKLANSLQHADMFVVWEIFPVFWSHWVCLFLSPYQKSFFYLSSFSLLHKSSALLFPPFNVLCMHLPHVCCFSFIVVFLLLFSQAVILSWTLSTCTGSFCSPTYSSFTSSHLLLEVALSFSVDDVSYKVDPVNVLVNVFVTLIMCYLSAECVAKGSLCNCIRM